MQSRQYLYLHYAWYIPCGEYSKNTSISEGVWNPHIGGSHWDLFLTTMELASVLGAALGTVLGGVIIAFAAAAGSLPRSGMSVVDILVIAITGIAILTAARLPGRPQLHV